MSERLRGALTGHVWTVVPHLRHRLRRSAAPPDLPWSTTVVDPRLGPVRLTGALRENAGADTVALVVHGLGGNADAGYCLDAADAASRAGWACLRINMRGADGLGQDLYHAALASDLSAAIDSAALASFRRVVVIGFSLGGHLALRYALSPDPRVHAVAAVCSPLDLRHSAVAFDRRRSAPYRAHVLRELKAAYRTADRRGAAPRPMQAVDAVQTIRGWDECAVVPRFGFDSADDYYEKASAGPRLPELKVPAVYIGAPFDPMVPKFTVDRPLDEAGNKVTAHWIDGAAGHVGFGDRSMFDRIVGWVDA